jgi:LDH2 family malate/lactate/ureidoglycolate dehydrogenase
MQKISPDRVRLGTQEALELSDRILVHSGYAPADARVISAHFVDAALCGYEYSGMPKLLDAIEHRRAKEPRKPVATLRETPVSILLDGGNNIGMLAVYRATELAIAKARTSGIALVGVTNSWMSGRSAYYMEMVARADLIGVHTVGAARSVAPVGGTKPILGTNPIAFGFPGPAGPLIVDMGTSAIMLTDMSLRQRVGEPLPEGVAIDVEGRPTRDATAAMKGAMLPFGGHKGFGLALAMQAMGILGGSGMLGYDKDYGYVLIVIDPSIMLPVDDYKARLANLVARVKGVPRQPGVDEIRLPSERSFRERERNRPLGIEFDRLIYDRLLAYCPG